MDHNSTAYKAHPTDRPGDGVVSVVLDELIEMKGWGPEAIFPDQKLSSDLEMSESDIAAFAKRVSRRLLKNSTFDFSKWNQYTLKQVVDSIHSFQQAQAV